MPERQTMEEFFASISEHLQALVRQQDELIKYLTDSTREELRAAAQRKSPNNIKNAAPARTSGNGHTDPKEAIP